MWWIVLALAHPIVDATRIERGHKTCITIKDHPDHVCWTGRERTAVSLEGAVPTAARERFDPPMQVLDETQFHDSTCVIDLDHQVWCQGKAWRERFGFPADTTTEHPVRIDSFDDAEQIAEECILRDGELLCATQAGVQSRLKGVRAFGKSGWALLEDGTGWHWKHSPPVLWQQDVVAVSTRGGLWQSADGTVYAGDNHPLKGVTGGTPAGLVGNADDGCALTPGGGVTCWARPAPKPGYWWPKDKVPHRYSRPSNNHTPIHRTAPTCTLTERDLRCVWGPTEAVYTATEVQTLAATQSLSCFLQGQQASCLGYLLGRRYEAPDAVEEDILQLTSDGARIYALRDNGEVLVTTGSKPSDSIQTPWQSLGVVQGATSIDAVDDLICAFVGITMQCRSTRVPHWVSFDKPPGEPSTNLCIGNQCLVPEDPDPDHVEFWVVEQAEPTERK